MSVHGEIDLATVPRLQTVGTRVLSNAGRLVVDLSETTFLDVGGVRTLEQLARRARAAGGALVLVATHALVLRILSLAAHSWLTVASDLETALALLNSEQLKRLVAE